MVQRDQIYASTDPDDSTIVSGLASFSVAAGDTFPSGTLDDELKQAITKVFDQSATWDEGGKLWVGAGGTFSTPTIAITNSNLTQVHFTADLSSGGSTDLTVGGDLYVSGGSQFAKTLVVSSQNSVATMTGALPTIASLSCPSPPGGFCFLSAVGDGTAGTSEINFGAGTSVQGVSSVGRGGEDGYYLWNNTDNTLEVSADGVYKVEFVGVTEVAAAITITVSFYTGSTLVHRFNIRVHSVTDPHNLVGTWVGFVRTTEPISVTINSGSGDNAQLMKSSTLFVQRLA